MKVMYPARLCLILLAIAAGFSFTAWAQAPNPALVGYFHNWNDASAPYVPLDQVDSRYNMINVSFAVPGGGTDYRMEFIPTGASPSVFLSQIQALQAQGKKVLISVGGATAPVALSNAMERDTFVATMTNIIDVYGFDGMDIDLEGASLSTSGGTIANPVDAPVINLVAATRQIMAQYRNTHGRKLILTMAPETAFVQGGKSAYGGIWGAYLPVIHALRDSLDMLYVQLYNSGSMYGNDGIVYNQGSADFIEAMCEDVIQGFNTGGGMFAGLPASKVAVALPACSMAAGGGFVDTAAVRAAIRYLKGEGPKPGSYTLLTPGGYPGLRGMMTWSINWDAVPGCGSVYEYAANYQRIFGSIPLPVIFGAWSVKPEGNCSAGLYWTVLSDEDADHYRIMRRSTAGDWREIGRIKGRQLAGAQEYRYRDEQALQGVNSYRIVSVDADGTETATAPLAVQQHCEGNDISVYPTTTAGPVHIDLGNGLGSPVIQVYDVAGRMLAVPIFGAGHRYIADMSSYGEGCYFIRISAGGRTQVSRIFVAQQ